MIPTNIRNIKKGILLFVGILGVWLVYWDVTDAVNAFLHENNIPPLLVGVAIIMIVGYFGIRVFR